MPRQVFLNLPVKDLKKSMAFFKKVGYKFNPQFTNEKAACMVVSDTIYVMLLTKPFFQTFLTKKVADATKTTEVLVSLKETSRAAVDKRVKKAFAAGAKRHTKPADHGWMYQWGFQDLDGHVWEHFWIDLSKVPKT